LAAVALCYTALHCISLRPFSAVLSLSRLPSCLYWSPCSPPDGCDCVQVRSGLRERERERGSAGQREIG
jgi:hypothetical protein